MHGREMLKVYLARLRERIEAARLFDVSLAHIVEAIIAAACGKIDAIGATPFLRDTTPKNVIVTPEGSFSGIVNVADLCCGDAPFPAAPNTGRANGLQRTCKLRLRLDATGTARPRPNFQTLREPMRLGPHVGARPKFNGLTRPRRNVPRFPRHS
jgi:hypothetical protein